MLEALTEQKEIGNKYKINNFNLFARLFCTISEEVITRFGEEGKIAIVESVKQFGKRRGKEIAELVIFKGKPLTLKNFMVYSTFDSADTAKYKMNIIDGNVEVVIRSCIFCEGCEDWGKKEFGKIYCEFIDEAIMEGYNPDIKFELASSLTHGDKHCIQRYMVKS